MLIVGMVVLLIWSVGAMATTQWLLWSCWKYAANIEDFIWDAPANLVMGLLWPVFAYWTILELLDDK